MAKVSDDISLGELVRKAAKVLTRAGLEHRIDIYRDIEVDDPAVRMMLGRRHRVRVRVKITAASLLFEGDADKAGAEKTGTEKTAAEKTGTLASVIPLHKQEA